MAGRRRGTDDAFCAPGDRDRVMPTRGPKALAVAVHNAEHEEWTYPHHTRGDMAKGIDEAVRSVVKGKERDPRAPARVGSRKDGSNSPRRARSQRRTWF